MDEGGVDDLKTIQCLHFSKQKACLLWHSEGVVCLPRARQLLLRCVIPMQMRRVCDFFFMQSNCDRYISRKKPHFYKKPMGRQ